MMKIILASASPRRRRLMRRLGLPFAVCDSGVAEEARNLPAALLSLHFARQKAEASARRPHLWRQDGTGKTDTGGGPALIIGADTSLDLDGLPLGKPAGEGDALQMLLQLRGRTHRVITALYFFEPASGKSAQGIVQTTVVMRRTPRAVLAEYVRSGEPMDKAGAYAIQGRGASLVEAIKGCYFSVMGFPLCEVARLLSRFGILPAAEDPCCLTAEGKPCPRISPEGLEDSGRQSRKTVGDQP